MTPHRRQILSGTQIALSSIPSYVPNWCSQPHPLDIVAQYCTSEYTSSGGFPDLLKRAKTSLQHVCFMSYRRLSYGPCDESDTTLDESMIANIDCSAPDRCWSEDAFVVDIEKRACKDILTNIGPRRPRAEIFSRSSAKYLPSHE